METPDSADALRVASLMKAPRRSPEPWARRRAAARSPGARPRENRLREALEVSGIVICAPLDFGVGVDEGQAEALGEPLPTEVFPRPSCPRARSNARPEQRRELRLPRSRFRSCHASQRRSAPARRHRLEPPSISRPPAGSPQRAVDLRSIGGTAARRELQAYVKRMLSPGGDQGEASMTASRSAWRTQDCRTAMIAIVGPFQSGKTSLLEGLRSAAAGRRGKARCAMAPASATPAPRRAPTP